MDEKILRDKPLASARKLYSFLSSLPDQVSLDSYQRGALFQDMKTIEDLISELGEANSKEDWRTVWNIVKEMQKGIGGYVGDELGQHLTQLVEDFWHDVLDSYSEVMK